MIRSRRFPAGGLLCLFAALCVTFVTGACTKAPVSVCRSNDFEARGGEGIAAEIMRLEQAIAREPEDSRKSDLYFHLALLYSHNVNPAPDYPRSLEMLDRSLALDPDGLESDEALYLKALLGALVETDRRRVRAANKAAKLERSNKKLKATNARLSSENRDLKDVIEKLRRLELMLERKRLNLKE